MQAPSSMSMGSSSAQPHISSALQGHHDSGIPSFLPLMFAFNSGFICGVLNFGEAISFSLQWNVARYLGLLGPDTTFAKGVMLSQFLCIASAIPMYISGWREVLLMFGYTVTGTAIVNHVPHSALLSAPIFVSRRPQFIKVGVYLLIFGHVQTVEWFSASLFMLFSFSKLIQSSLNFGKERNIALGRFSMDTPRLSRKLALDETETVVLQLQASPNQEIITGTPHWPAVSLFLQGRPRLCAVYERIFPAISMEGYSVETVFVINAVFRALSGLSQGTTGAGGPPVIAAYAWFNPTKGAIRGLSGLNFVTCGSLMCDHAVRCRGHAAVSHFLCSYDIYCSHGSHLWRSSEIQLYASLCVAALLGSSLGTWLRRFVVQEVILHGLFWLVWGNCAMLLHVFTYTSVFEMPWLPLLYVLLTPVLVVSAIVCHFFPMRVISVRDYFFSCCTGSSNSTSAPEHQPLLPAEAADCGGTFAATTSTADATVLLKAADARS